MADNVETTIKSEESRVTKALNAYQKYVPNFLVDIAVGSLAFAMGDVYAILHANTRAPAVALVIALAVGSGALILGRTKR